MTIAITGTLNHKNNNTINSHFKAGIPKACSRKKSYIECKFDIFSGKISFSPKIGVLDAESRVHGPCFPEFMCHALDSHALDSVEA